MQNKYISEENVVQSIRDSLLNSKYLRLDEGFLLKNGHVSVQVINNDKPKKVVSELVDLVKLSNVNESNNSYLNVVNCSPKLTLCFKKNVSFWKGSNFDGIRITRTIANEYIEMAMLSGQVDEAALPIAQTN